mmetsp:Transcript_6803/g.17036  ORF Transcript_6803/g.17036 Transcript_6803/m.17036 type:complete len:121 (-) Transcript_6803:86-448(-)
MVLKARKDENASRTFLPAVWKATLFALVLLGGALAKASDESDSWFGNTNHVAGDPNKGTPIPIPSPVAVAVATSLTFDVNGQSMLDAEKEKQLVVPGWNDVTWNDDISESDDDDDDDDDG